MRHRSPLLFLLPAAALPLLIGWAIGATAAPPPPVAPASGPQAASAVSQALGAALRADAPAALAALKDAPAGQFQGKDADFRRCMLERHERKAPPPAVAATATAPRDAFAAQVLGIYQRYWWHAVREPQRRGELERTLKAELAAAIGEPAPGDGDEAFEALYAKLDARLRESGLHPLQGRTPPLYDLFLWGGQEQRDYTVALPGGVAQPVKVFVMDGWISRGWSHYTACGKTGAAGWVKPEGLYAVRESYGDLRGEDFKVSFLGHEAQHFADLARWPKLPPWRLEYRAKLVELAQADSSREKLLDRFYRAQDDDLDHPHPYANKRVLTDAAQALGLGADADLRKADPAALRRVAAEALLADTRKLESEPAGTYAEPAKGETTPAAQPQARPADKPRDKPARKPTGKP